MSIVLSPTGEAKFGASAIYGTTPENLLLRLYTACSTTAAGGFAAGTPSPTSVLGDFTEATFTGYSAKTLTATQTGTTWSAFTGTPATSQYNAATPQSWTNSGGSPQTILGYYYVGATSGSYYGGEAYATPQVINASGGVHTLPPKFQFGTSPAPTY
jgi:hypothetical protein